MAGGRLITIEGLDGAGKSTLAHALKQQLDARGLTVELMREPGGVEVSEHIRALVKDPSLSVTPRAEALLYAAARAQLVEELVAPLLSRGAVVVLDRFVDSSLAYQAGGRDLDIAGVREINRFATGGLEPDLTLLLRIHPAEGRARQAQRSLDPDRMEREAEEFFLKIAAAYEELAHMEPQRIVVIDAAQDADSVLADALAAIEKLLALAPLAAD